MFKAYFYTGAVIFYGAWFFASEVDTVGVERSIYKEIANLSEPLASKREAEALCCIQKCSELPLDLVEEIEKWVGHSREPGPSFSCISLDWVQKLNWVFPVVPAVTVGIKSFLLKDYASADMSLLCSSVFLGGLATWWCSRNKKSLNQKAVVGDSIYDIEAGYCYFPLHLKSIVEQKQLQDFMNTQKKKALSCSL